MSDRQHAIASQFIGSPPLGEEKRAFGLVMVEQQDGIGVYLFDVVSVNPDGTRKPWKVDPTFTANVEIQILDPAYTTETVIVQSAYALSPQTISIAFPNPTVPLTAAMPEITLNLFDLADPAVSFEATLAAMTLQPNIPDE